VEGGGVKWKSSRESGDNVYAPLDRPMNYAKISDARQMGVCCLRELIAPDPLGPLPGFFTLSPAYPPKTNHHPNHSKNKQK